MTFSRDSIVGKDKAFEDKAFEKDMAFGKSLPTGRDMAVGRDMAFGKSLSTGRDTAAGND